MKYANLITICCAMLLSSCVKGHLNTDDNPSGETAKDIIGWNVKTSGLETRALVEDYVILRDACTQTQTQEAEKIGLLGKYTLDGSSEVVFDNVDLWWWTKEDGNPYNDILGNMNHWNYAGEDVSWVNDAEYTFKAYFPKTKVELQAGSGADRLLAVYDTERSQYDFLVAHRQIRAREENPVNLNMEHTLAALKFDFQFVEDGINDDLISCWLENHGANGFYTSSTLNFSNEIAWPKSSAAPVGTPIYYWEPFVPLAITGNKAVDAYSTSAADDKGSLFTENSGWLLVIPQTSDVEGTLQLCFRTAISGDYIYRLNLPAYAFKAGYRYTYHVKMTATELSVELSITDWNERKSSYEIEF